MSPKINKSYLYNLEELSNWLSEYGIWSIFEGPKNMHPIVAIMYDINKTFEDDIFLVRRPENIEPIVKLAAHIA